MNRKLQILIFIAVSLVFITSIHAQKVTGVYERFSVGKGSGDLEGMRVVIFKAGPNEAYHAIVQIAGGGADDPEPAMVDVTVKGRKVSFTVSGVKYSGTVTATRLTLKEDGGSGETLTRKPESSFFR
ncbi:MAG: hypothetical protein JO314_09075 [Acidobacteria bacterium]|nr:hypothetical protein [Acidobacteriota bacterium]